ncbi:hypothetical protein [Mesobacillus subterraneus]|uniref:Uncharacterized protein n=1 Tax=Mesobacillus subterraneus TaxID=285983 RepID=A0A427TLZ0_9BACI|nr:hypothetical protein [Mesobacillus subterraneus]RSD25376.1 hypothetical protein EJA10_16315 [Mesobacillus subterraneus]
MNQSFNNLINKAKLTLNYAFGHAKEKIYSVTGTSSASVQQIADYIKAHPDTKVTNKHYLGVTLSFYELEQGEMKYYMETNQVKILQLDVHSHYHSVVSYRSYRDHFSLDTPVKFPDLNGV